MLLKRNISHNTRLDNVEHDETRVNGITEYCSFFYESVCFVATTLGASLYLFQVWWVLLL